MCQGLAAPVEGEEPSWLLQPERPRGTEELLWLTGGVDAAGAKFLILRGRALRLQLLLTGSEAAPSFSYPTAFCPRRAATPMTLSSLRCAAPACQQRGNGVMNVQEEGRSWRHWKCLSASASEIAGKWPEGLSACSSSGRAGQR